MSKKPLQEKIITDYPSPDHYFMVPIWKCLNLRGEEVQEFSELFNGARWESERVEEIAIVEFSWRGCHEILIQSRTLRGIAGVTIMKGTDTENKVKHQWWN